MSFGCNLLSIIGQTHTWQEWTQAWGRLALCLQHSEKVIIHISTPIGDSSQFLAHLFFFVLHCTILTIFFNYFIYFFKIKIQLYHSFIHCPLSKLSHFPFFPIFQLWPLYTLTVIIYIKWICICTYICMYMSKCTNTTRLVCIMLLILTFSGITIWITNWCAHPSGRLVIPLPDFLVSLLFFY